MAVENEGAQPGQDSSDDQKGQTDSKKGGLKKIVMIAVVLLTVGAAGAGYVFFMGEEAAVAENEVKQGPIEYLEISPAFIINYPVQGQQRFLQAALTVMAREPGALEAVAEHMPVIRHNLIDLFSAQALVLLQQRPVDMEALRQLVTEEIQNVLIDRTGSPGIEEALFTAFIMQ